MHGDGRDIARGEPAAALVDRFALVGDGVDRFRSAHRPGLSDGRGSASNLFGGLLVAQALGAAAATLDEPRPARVIQASFLRAGRAGEHLWHEVERTRDGASFATRRVVVGQGDRRLLAATVEFHRVEPGDAYAPPAPPGVAGPEGLAPGRYDGPFVESRDVPAAAGSAAPRHARQAWFRVIEPLGPDPLLHQLAVAYLSDHGPTRAAREPHPHLADDTRRHSVSLDHTVWFHEPVDATAWLLSEMVPAATGAGRGLTLGSIFTRSGRLAATVAQAVLLRAR